MIEPSNSPWRAQPLVVTQENHKRRMVIDYSQTVNKYTLLDAYPLPRMRDVVQNVARYKVYSTLDLTSAYHQVELPPQNKLYTAFEADGALWQWKRIPFGLTNAVPCFQRIIDDIIKICKGTFAYLDNITVGGTTQQEHDVNLDRFLAVAKNHNLTFNESKCIYNTDTIDLLGYRIKNGTLQPDPARVKTFQDLPSPNNRKEQQRVIGLFAYYANCCLLLKLMPLRWLCLATLNQNGKPVAFYSRSLSKCEQAHSSVEKEATAIVEAVRKWSHFLTGKRFQIVTDQRSVSFMYDNKNCGKY